MSDASEIWWVGPESPPAALSTAFTRLTDAPSDGRRGLAAAIYISRVRRETGAGPTFGELFKRVDVNIPELLGSVADGLTGQERRALVWRFQFHVAVHWRRMGWIAWDKGKTRSLRTGRQFHNTAKAHRQQKKSRQQKGAAS